MQMELFDEPAEGQQLLPRHGDQIKTGNWLNRNWHGWLQVREIGDRAWRFVIEGFGDIDCAVLALDPAGRVICRGVPIDSRGQILIDGRRYGRSRWRH